MIETRVSSLVRSVVALTLLICLIVPPVALASPSGEATASSEVTASYETSGPPAQSRSSETSSSPGAAASPESGAVSARLASAGLTIASLPGGLLAEDSDSRVSFTGQWHSVQSAAFSGGSYRYSYGGGSTATVAVSGTTIAIIGSVGPSYGIITVVVDGISRGNVSCYAASYAHQQTLATYSGLTDRAHSVTITVTGNRSAQSTGTVVVFDAFEVASTGDPAAIYTGFSRAEEKSDRIVVSGFWVRQASAAFSGGGYAYSAASGASVVAAFSGSGISLMGSVGPSYGNVQVSVDGVSRGTFSCYAGTYAHHVPIFSTEGLAAGTHTIKLVVTGTKDTRSKSAVVVFDSAEAWNETAPAAFYGGFARIEESSTKLNYTGVWGAGSSPVFSGDGYRYAYKSGAKLVALFVGGSVTLYGSVGPSYGQAEVFVDAVSQGVIDCYAPTYAHGVAIFSASGLNPEIHAFTVKVLGAGSASSSGSIVVIDALQTVASESVRSVRFDRAPSLTYGWSSYLVVDKSDFRVYWVRDGLLRGVYPVAIGKPSTPTPSAIWRVGRKEYMYPYGVFGPRRLLLFRQYGSSFVETNYGIHGTNQPWVIGTQASHGCIRLYNQDILLLWPEVPLYTMVVTRD